MTILKDSGRTTDRTTTDNNFWTYRAAERQMIRAKGDIVLSENKLIKQWNEMRHNPPQCNNTMQVYPCPMQDIFRRDI